MGAERGRELRCAAFLVAETWLGTLCWIESGRGAGVGGAAEGSEARRGKAGEGFGLSRSLLLLLRDSGNLWHAHAIAGALDHTGGGGDGGLTGAWKAQRRARRREEGTWSGGTLFSWLCCRLRGVEESLSLLGEGGDERAGRLLGIAKPAGMEGGGGAWSLQ